MPVNLADGQRFYLQKNKDGFFDEVRIKLGWYTPHKLDSLWFSEFFKSNVFECHAYMLMCQEGVTIDYEDIINYCNAEHPSQSVSYLGKCLDDKGRVTEIMLVDPEKIPRQYNMIVFMADVSKAKSNGQHFGMVNKVHIDLFDEEENQKICQYNLPRNYDGLTSIIFGSLSRCKDGWEFTAIGEGSRENVMDNIMKSFNYDEDVIAI